MALNMDDINTAITSLTDSLLSRVESLQKRTQMEDEYFAKVVSAAITSSVDGGLRSVEVIKKGEFIDKQILTETNRASLTTRQTTALDDARKVKKAELLGNTVSLIESGGNAAPADVWTSFTDAVADI